VNDPAQQPMVTSEAEKLKRRVLEMHITNEASENQAVCYSKQDFFRYKFHLSAC
jgi:hypothetical protein